MAVCIFSFLLGNVGKGTRLMYVLTDKLINTFLHEIPHILEARRIISVVGGSVADPDPGSGIGCFLTPGSGIRDPE